MKFVKKCFVLGMVIALACAVTSASAYFRASEQIDRCVLDVFKSGGGKITISFYVAGTEKMQCLGAESIVIYRKTGGSWVEVESYDRHDRGMAGNNMPEFSGNIVFSGTAGKDYKIQAEFFAENSSGYDSRTRTAFVTA